MDQKKETKKCVKCGKVEKISFHKSGRKTYMIAACPDNHYARFITAPGAMWAALG